LLNEFSELELISLCQDIGLDYHALPGAGTFGKTREMIEVARAQDKVRMLQSRVRELKPTAYVAAGFSSPDPADQMPAAARGAPAPEPRAGARPAIPRTVVLLLLLLVLVSCAALVLPRLLNSSAAQATPTPSVASSLPTTDGLALAPVVEAVTVPPAAPVANEADGAAGQNQTTAPVATATEQPALAATVGGTSAEEPATAQVEVPAAPTSTPGADEAHPAAQNVRELNEVLLSFYTGKIAPKDLEDYWMGDALRVVINFGSVRLPRAMRVSPARRSALDITYEYLRPPAVASETADGAVVTSREFWRYANTLNQVQVCEVREYEYRLVREGDRYWVRSFRSQLLETGCRP
jgi:hypothetical protein